MSSYVWIDKGYEHITSCQSQQEPRTNKKCCTNVENLFLLKDEDKVAQVT